MRWRCVSRLSVIHLPTHVRLRKLTEYPANFRVISELRKDELQDALCHWSAFEVVVTSGENGRFWAAVVRTGYDQASARRDMFFAIEVRDCGLGDLKTVEHCYGA